MTETVQSIRAVINPDAFQSSASNFVSNLYSNILDGTVTNWQQVKESFEAQGRIYSDLADQRLIEIKSRINSAKLEGNLSQQQYWEAQEGRFQSWSDAWRNSSTSQFDQAIKFGEKRV